jgi:hypothetical protein
MLRVVSWWKRGWPVKEMVEMLTIRLLSRKVGVIASVIYILYQLAKTEASHEIVMEVLKAKPHEKNGNGNGS